MGMQEKFPRITMGQIMRHNEQRLHRQITELQKQWDLLTEKLSKLEKQRIVETDVSEQVKLDSQISETKQQHNAIEQKLNELEQQLSQYSPDKHFNKLVFIKADANDAHLCKKICQLLDEEDLAEYVKPEIERQKPGEIREAFEVWILDCDALIVIYGNVDFGWLNQVFKNVRKIVCQRADQPLPAYVLCDPSPEQKQLLTFSFHGISTLQYESCSNELKFREFINSL